MIDRVSAWMAQGRAFAEKHHRWMRFLMPAGALVSGLGSVLLVRRGVQFAPVMSASVVLAWTLAAAIGRWFPAKAEASGFKKVARWLAAGFVAGLFQDALFFLLPLWFGSATWPSVNMIAPLVLAGMALFSCFEELYVHFLLTHPAIRATFSGVVLFANLCAAIPVLLNVPLGPSVAIAAAASTVLAAIAMMPLEQLKKMRTISIIAASMIVAAASMWIFAPLMPPVPMQCMSSVVAREIVDKEPVDPAKTFPSGLPRIYGHFAVAGPDNLVERVRFRWTHNGEVLKKELETEVSGGRKKGFRTFGFVSNPRAGHWSVELYAESDQLIGRERFVVEP